VADDEEFVALVDTVVAESVPPTRSTRRRSRAT